MKGKPLQYSVAPASRYQGDMSRLINAMIKDYE
ncbi:phage head morphogenesis protein, partial [Klebsiella oxytoca]